MTLKKFRYISFVLLFVVSALPAARAGDEPVHNVFSRRISSALASGVRFEEHSLFAPALTGRTHPETLREETLLQPLTGEVSALYAAGSKAIALNLKSGSGKVFRLLLQRAEPTSDNFVAGTIDATGRRALPYTAGLHYQGSVAGEDNSFASVSVFANGEVMILFSTPEGNFVAGRLEDNSGNYVLYNDADWRNRPEMPCGVVDAPDTSPGETTGNKTTGALVCNKVRMYWEVTYNVFTFKGGLVNTQNYAVGLFNQMQTLYTNDGMAVELKSLYVWTVADDIPTTNGSSAGLDKFKGYWNRVGNSFDGDVAHLITKTNNGNGGLAYVNVLCNRNNAYAYSDITGSYSQVPSYSWDAMVVSHETGHNMGSQHTHWCGWNTGVNNACGSIDNCTTQQPGSNCTTCTATFLNSQPASAWKGTIMSYCHLVQRGISLANGFGPLPGAYIRGRISSVTCLSSVINVNLASTPVCNGPGSVTLSFAANNRGVAPYEFLWSNGDTSQNLLQIAAPSTYTVSIGDSNQCSADFPVTVPAGTTAGNGSIPVIFMPICCQTTNLKIPLQSTPPTFNSACETVYWLRSATPLTTDAAVRDHFDTAVTSRFVPDNLASVSASVGATLEVAVPASCNGPMTWYYLPVVARLPRTADSIVSVSGTATVINGGGVGIGQAVTLPNQLALQAGCYAADTPDVRSLTVTISGYTGRPNLLRLVVEDNAARVLWQQFGLPGNGTYTIPATAFGDSMLRALTIKALDYNCSAPSTCTTSTLNITAARKVSFLSRPLRAARACAIGNAVRLDFSPANCTPLTTSTFSPSSNTMTVSPNPAEQTAILRFQSTAARSVELRVTNISGQVVYTRALDLPAAVAEHRLDLRQWAKGVYFLSLRGANGPTESLKLVVH